jgi:hypothetical protein
MSWKCYVQEEMDWGLHPKAFISLEYCNLLPLQLLTCSIAPNLRSFKSRNINQILLHVIIFLQLGGGNNMVRWWHGFLHHIKKLIGLVVNVACIVPKYAFYLEIDFVYIALSFLSIEGWVLEYHGHWRLVLKQKGFCIPRRLNLKLRMKHVISWVKLVPMARIDFMGESCITQCIKCNRTPHVCLC